MIIEPGSSRRANNQLYRVPQGIEYCQSYAQYYAWHLRSALMLSTWYYHGNGKVCVFVCQMPDSLAHAVVICGAETYITLIVAPQEQTERLAREHVLPVQHGPHPDTLPYGLPWSIALRLPMHPQHVESPVGHPHPRPFPVRIVQSDVPSSRVESFKHDRALATATRKWEETTALDRHGISERYFS